MFARISFFTADRNSRECLAKIKTFRFNFYGLVSNKIPKLITSLRFTKSMFNSWKNRSLVHCTSGFVELLFGVTCPCLHLRPSSPFQKHALLPVTNPLWKIPNAFYRHQFVSIHPRSHHTTFLLCMHSGKLGGWANCHRFDTDNRLQLKIQLFQKSTPLLVNSWDIFSDTQSSGRSIKCFGSACIHLFMSGIFSRCAPLGILYHDVTIFAKQTHFPWIIQIKLDPIYIFILLIKRHKHCATNIVQHNSSK
jgi:hypothetical protein